MHDAPTPDGSGRIIPDPEVQSEFRTLWTHANWLV